MSLTLKYLAKKIILPLFIIYILLGLFLFIFQNFLIYYPDGQDFFDCPVLSHYEPVVFNETRFYYKNQSSKSVVVYYHGNAGSACDRGIFRETFEKTGHSVIFAEYAGYSGERRRPSEELILTDAKNINKFIDSKEYEKIILYGQSIGSGPAAYHSNISEKVDVIALTAPFSKLSDVAGSKFPIYPVEFLLREEYNNIELLKGYEGRILIFHGEKDNVVPKRFSKKLYESLQTDEARYVLIGDKGHNNIWESQKFKSILVEFMKSQ